MDQLGRYHLEKKIGEGGMATVYLARMLGPGGFEKPVAIKVLHASLEGNEYFNSEFLNEARLCGSLNHHNIVQTIDFGIENDRYFLTMEYVNGVTLSAVLRHYHNAKKSIPISIISDIMAQLCDGLDYAHTAVDGHGNPLKMVHRDLKPGNILINTHGLVKIADFGVAKATSNLTFTVKGTVKGTLGYMAPEQAVSAPIDPRADIFALGACLFALLTLEPLYAVRTNERVDYERIVYARYDDRMELLGNYPRALVELVQKMLAARPENRIPGARVAKQAINVAFAQVINLDLSLELRDVVTQIVQKQAEKRQEIETLPNLEVDLVQSTSSSTASTEDLEALETVMISGANRKVQLAKSNASGNSPRNSSGNSVGASSPLVAQDGVRSNEVDVRGGPSAKIPDKDPGAVGSENIASIQGTPEASPPTPDRFSRLFAAILLLIAALFVALLLRHA